MGANKKVDTLTDSNEESVKKILVVEDDMIISLVIENMVKELGHEVCDKCVLAEQAVESAMEHSPNVILMDIRLKGDMDGIDAVRKIKEKLDPAPAIVYLTGNSDKLNYERAEATGFAELISKPFTIAELKAALDSIP